VSLKTIRESKKKNQRVSSEVFKKASGLSTKTKLCQISLRFFACSTLAKHANRRLIRITGSKQFYINTKTDNKDWKQGASVDLK
jgi:hypothetical protein